MVVKSQEDMGEDDDDDDDDDEEEEKQNSWKRITNCNQKIIC